MIWVVAYAGMAVGAIGVNAGSTFFNIIGGLLLGILCAIGEKRHP